MRWLVQESDEYFGTSDSDVRVTLHFAETVVVVTSLLPSCAVTSYGRMRASGVGVGVWVGVILQGACMYMQIIYLPPNIQEV